MRIALSKFALVGALIGSLGLAACENPNGGYSNGGYSSGGNPNGASSWGTKQTVGTGLGAVGGGLLGSQIGGGNGRLVAVGLGAVLGGLLGNEVGASLDSADRAEMARAGDRAYSAPLGQGIAWNNPQSGNSGLIIPTRDGRDGSGAYCREFNQKVTVGGQTQSAYGTACQQPDGSWKIINS